MSNNFLFAAHMSEALERDHSGPKPGDLYRKPDFNYYALPGWSPWLILLVHPDDPNLLYKLPVSPNPDRFRHDYLLALPHPFREYNPDTQEQGEQLYAFLGFGCWGRAEVLHRDWRSGYAHSDDTKTIRKLYRYMLRGGE